MQKSLDRSVSNSFSSSTRTTCSFESHALAFVVLVWPQHRRPVYRVAKSNMRAGETPADSVPVAVTRDQMSVDSLRSSAEMCPSSRALNTHCLPRVRTLRANTPSVISRRVLAATSPATSISPWQRQARSFGSLRAFCVAAVETARPAARRAPQDPAADPRARSVRQGPARQHRGTALVPFDTVRRRTSSTKRGPVERGLRRHLKANPRFEGRIVSAMGMRAEQSRACAQKIPQAAERSQLPREPRLARLATDLRPLGMPGLRRHPGSGPSSLLKK